MFRIGTTVGNRFIIRHLLAEGGMAEIYLAESIEAPGVVVLKRLKVNLPDQKRALRLFVNEAELIITLRHPNIIQGFELITENGNNFIVMEHIVGKPVEQLLRDFPIELRVKFALSVGIEVCRALSYAAHYKGGSGQELRLVHKDISPQNLLISATGQTKIIDFGVAQTRFSQGDEQEILRGNIHYMSPEQRQGLELTQASDVYSLGLVMLEIMQGQKWRPDDILADPFETLDRGSAKNELIAPLKIALAVAREDRFANCDEFLDGLLEVKNKLSFRVNAVLNEALSKSSKKYEIKKWSTVLTHVSHVSSIIFILFFVGVELFRPHLFIIGPEYSSGPYEIDEHNKLTAKPSSMSNVWGQLNLLVYPWAEVFINDEFYGVTPMGELRLPPGDYVVQLKNPNYSAIALRRVKIYADKRTELIHNF